MASNASEHPAAGQAGQAATAGRRPLIGLTTYREQATMLVWNTEFALLHQVYVDCVARAGGIPVLLPPPGEETVAAAADALTEALDALVLTGGSDVDPARYQQQPHDQATITRPGRDDWELRLLGRALAAGLPVLGVCRGAQVLNVALGGTLDQHVPDRAGHQRHCPAPGVFGQTTVTLRGGSVLAGLLGPEATVACHHHQAIDKVAPGLEVVGTSSDGTVEAVELPGGRFVLGVQWHPEQDGGDLRLFEALVAAARAHEPADNQAGKQQPGQQGASRGGL